LFRGREENELRKRAVGMKPVRLAAYEEACWRLGKRCLIYNYLKLKFKICILLQKLGKLLIIIF
jgi:hypothetical protein